MMMMMRRSSGRGFGAKPGCNKKKGDREMGASSAGRKEEKEAQLHEYSCIPSYQNFLTAGRNGGMRDGSNKLDAKEGQVLRCFVR